MAAWDAEQLLIRIREVLESGAGTLRTISSGTNVANPPGLDTNEESRRAGVAPVTGSGFPVEARILSVKRSPSGYSVIGNLALYDFEAEVRAVYPVNTKTTLSSAARDRITGIAAKHADVFAQALGYPGNLTTTTAGSPTDVISGLLTYLSSDYVWAGNAGEGGTLTARHRFKGIAKSAPAVA